MADDTSPEQARTEEDKAAKEGGAGAQASPAGKERWSRASDTQHVTDFAKDRPRRGDQAGAWALWFVGLALEVLAVLQLTGTFQAQWDATLWQRVLVFVAALAVDLVLVLVAQRLWRTYTQGRAKARGKKAAGPSVVGVFMACVAFVPMVLFFATGKNVDKRSLVASIVAAVLAAAGLGALAVVA